VIEVLPTIYKGIPARILRFRNRGGNVLQFSQRLHGYDDPAVPSFDPGIAPTV
jgi:hypothetical protein